MVKSKKLTIEHKEKIRQKLLGTPLTEERKKNISQSATGNINYGMRGKKQSKETKAKIKEALRLANLREDVRERKREAKIGEKNPMYGKHHSEAARSRISMSTLGKNNPMYGKTFKHTQEAKNKISEASTRCLFLSHPKTKFISLKHDFTSTKKGTIYQSKLEKAFLIILDTLSEISKINTQCVIIKYFDTSKNYTRRYIPDFLIVLKDDRKFLIEVKSFHWQRFSDAVLCREILRNKNRAALKYCMENNMKFLLWSYKQCNEKYIKYSLKI